MGKRTQRLKPELPISPGERLEAQLPDGRKQITETSAYFPITTHISSSPYAPTGFDYSNIAASARKQVLEEAQAIRRLLVNTARNIIQIGLRLRFVRDCLGRDKFQPWLAHEFEWSQATASKYMRAAEVFGNIECADRFQPSALYNLARHKVPHAAREEALERARHGESITNHSAQLIIRSYARDKGRTSISMPRRIAAVITRLEALLHALAPADRAQLCAEIEKIIVRQRG